MKRGLKLAMGKNDRPEKKHKKGMKKSRKRAY
jgi:hypothetical protein